MTEEEARAWVIDHFGPTTASKLQLLVAAVTSEAEHQNMVSPSTLGSTWARHVVDSAQLWALAEPVGSEDLWIDVGSGAGFPGLVIALLRPTRVLLVEPRKRRAEFLQRTVLALGLKDTTRVLCAKVESVRETATVISARAVGSLTDVLAWSCGCADTKTRWVLPKGRSAWLEMENARKMWQGSFHVEHSVTDPNSLIVLASGVSRR